MQAHKFGSNDLPDLRMAKARWRSFRIAAQAMSLSFLPLALSRSQSGRSGNGFIVARHFHLIYSPNNPIQRTRAMKRLGVFEFCEVSRGDERGVRLIFEKVVNVAEDFKSHAMARSVRTSKPAKSAF